MNKNFINKLKSLQTHNSPTLLTTQKIKLNNQKKKKRTKANYTKAYINLLLTLFKPMKRKQINYYH